MKKWITRTKSYPLSTALGKNLDVVRVTTETVMIEVFALPRTQDKKKGIDRDAAHKRSINPLSSLYLERVTLGDNPPSLLFSLVSGLIQSQKPLARTPQLQILLILLLLTKRSQINL